MQNKLYARVAIGTDIFRGWIFYECHTKEDFHKIVEKIMNKEQRHDNR